MLKQISFFAVLFVLVCASVADARPRPRPWIQPQPPAPVPAPAPVEAKPIELDVVEVEDPTGEIAVGLNERIRIRDSVMAGGSMTPVIAGPARIVRIDTVTIGSHAGRPVGGFSKSFEVLPTGRGKVILTIRKTSFSPDVPMEPSVFTFNVN